MKKQLFFLMSFILILTGCSESEVSEGPEEVKEILIEKVDLDKDVAQPTEVSSENYETDSGVVPYEVDSGSLTGVQFKTPYKLSDANGKKVDFNVKNTGSVAVNISINGGKPLLIKPGEEDFLPASVGTMAKEYIFKAVPETSGKISITYGITQRD